MTDFDDMQIDDDMPLEKDDAEFEAGYQERTKRLYKTPADCFRVKAWLHLLRRKAYT